MCKWISGSCVDLIKIEYGIKSKRTNTKNPQANSILEIIHQVKAHFVHMFELQNGY